MTFTTLWIADDKNTEVRNVAVDAIVRGRVNFYEVGGDENYNVYAISSDLPSDIIDAVKAVEGCFVGSLPSDVPQSIETLPDDFLPRLAASHNSLSDFAELAVADCDRD